MTTTPHLIDCTHIDRTTIATAERHYCTDASFRADVERVVHAVLLTHDDMHAAANNVRRRAIITTYLALDTTGCPLSPPREQDR